ncbi:MAG TPA: peptidylprolyl isomerase, partial [Iamia sp.]|nr:peptidylprolyl isomerase [Iamia sp.]
MRPRALTRPARTVATGAALVGLVLSATSCNVGRPPAATVEGRDISAERIDDLVAAFVEADPETFGPQVEGDGEDTYDMAAVAAILGTLVVQTVQAELADREGAIPDESERDEAEDLVRNSFVPGADAEPDPGTGEPTEEAAQAQETSGKVFDALTPETRAWLVDLRATTLALTREISADPEEVTAQARQIFEADPTPYQDLYCLRAIVVDGADVPAVQQRLAAGEDFGAVSAEVTIDTQVAQAGGELGQCLPGDQLETTQLAPGIIALVQPLQPGQVSDPF